MSSFTGTTGESSRGGGKGAAPTGPPTMFSDASSSFRRIVAEWYIQGTYQVRRTQQMPHLEASTLPVPSYSAQSPSLAKHGPSSSMSDPGELAKSAAVKCLVRAQENDIIPADVATPALKQRKVSEARPRHIPSLQRAHHQLGVPLPIPNTSPQTHLYYVRIASLRTGSECGPQSSLPQSQQAQAHETRQSRNR